ncbi:MAG: ankyrin repeat domain-containing protein [Bacteroidota bacterium]
MESLIYDLLKNKKTDELISQLKNDPALLSFVDSRGASLLMLSFYFRNQELSSYILSLQDPSNIYEAVIAGDLDTTMKFLASDPKLINKYSPDGFTVLGFAAFFDRPALARYLLEQGADANISSNNDFKVAPLHSAVAAKSLEITQLLLEHNADPNARQQNDVTPLHAGAHNSSLAIVKALLQAGADKDLKTKDGKNAMDFAREANAKEIIAIL